MPSVSDGELECPQCGHRNPAKADYCWECRFNFVHDERLREVARTAPPPPPRAKPIPPPYSTPQAEAAKPRAKVTIYQFLFELVIASIIVGGSWALLEWAIPDMSVLWFALGWAGALFLVMLSEGVLPDPETDVTKYFAFNPFQYRDDMNRKVLATHLWLFLPRVVLTTIRHGFSLVITVK
jgi:hypothetical protein